MLAATVRLTQDLDLAEECTQDAFAQALQTWGRSGVPDRPGAWLTTVARNRARDMLRREAVWRRTLPLLVTEDAVPGPEDAPERSVVDDDRLRLIFTCCHPALAREAQVALTLRLLCGLSTAEVARAFLVSEPTMAARVTRAKKKIAAARVPYRVPAAADLPRAGERGARGRPPALHHRSHGPGRRSTCAPRSGRLLDRAGPAAAPADAGRRRGQRPARAAAADRRPPGHPPRSRRPDAVAVRAGPDAMGPGPDQRGHRPADDVPGTAEPDAVRGRGRHRRGARRGADLGSDRLVGDRLAIRRPVCAVAVTGGRR